MAPVKTSHDDNDYHNAGSIARTGGTSSIGIGAGAEIDGSLQAKIAVAQSQQFRRRLSKLTTLLPIAEYICEFAAHSTSARAGALLEWTGTAASSIQVWKDTSRPATNISTAAAFMKLKEMSM